MKRDEPSSAPDPRAWQARVGFHAVLLLHFDAQGAAAMRRIGQFVYDMAIERLRASRLSRSGRSSSLPT